MRLHVFQRKSGDCPDLVFQRLVLGEKCRALFAEEREADSRGVRLDLEDVDRMDKFVLADKVDFILALAVPPTSDARIGRLFRKLLAEVALEGEAGKGVEVPPDERLERPKNFMTLLTQMLLTALLEDGNSIAD